jgi:small nuclear ribonucleoprotein (snRNP)-like protein
MKREIMIVIFTLFFILYLSNNTLAERAVRIKLSDGTEISGLIVSEDGEYI